MVPKEPFLTPKARSLRPKRMRSLTENSRLPRSVEIFALAQLFGLLAQGAHLGIELLHFVASKAKDQLGALGLESAKFPESVRSINSLRPTVARDGGFSGRAVHSLRISVKISSTVAFSDRAQSRLAQSRTTNSISDARGEKPGRLPPRRGRRAPRLPSSLYRPNFLNMVARATAHFRANRSKSLDDNSRPCSFLRSSDLSLADSHSWSGVSRWRFARSADDSSSNLQWFFKDDGIVGFDTGSGGPLTFEFLA